MENKKVFYGWIIVAASVLILAFMWALPMSCFSLFIKPISEDMGFSRTSLSLCSTIVSVTAMLASPFVGKWVETYSIKLIMILSAALVALGFTGYSFSGKLSMFYLSAVLIGLGLNGSSTLAVSIILKNWFIGKRGLATSIALAGSGVGGMIFSPLVTSLIGSNGWRNTYRLLAVLIIAIVLPTILIIILKKPADKGLEPYGADQSGAKSKGNNKKTELSMNLAELKTKPILWIYVFSTMIMGFSIGGVLMQAPSFLVDIGYTSSTAGTVVSAYLGIAVAGKIILGHIYDSKGSRAGILFGTGCFVISAISLMMAKSFPMLVLFTIFYGFGTCVGTVTPSVLTSKVFGSKFYGEIIGFTNLFGQLGLAVGTPLLASIYDFTGSYNYAWILCITFGIISILGMLYTVSQSEKMLLDTVH